MTNKQILDMDDFPSGEFAIKEQATSVVDFIRTKYSYVAAYHACDGKNLDLIQKNGLIPLNAIRLRQEAVRVFSHLAPDRVQQAIEKIEGQHFSGWYEDTVGVFASGKGSLSCPWLDYPWFIWRLARFAYESPHEVETFIREFMKDSAPTFVRCVFPMDWILKTIHPRYKLTSIYVKCINHISQFGHGDLRNFLYGIKGGVPPEYITEFIPAESYQN